LVLWGGTGCGPVFSAVVEKFIVRLDLMEHSSTIDFKLGFNYKDIKSVALSTNYFHKKRLI